MKIGRTPLRIILLVVKNVRIDIILVKNKTGSHPDIPKSINI